MSTRRLVAMLLCFYSVPASAQVFYSANPGYLSSKSEANNLLTVFRQEFPDTSITWADVYFPRNTLGNAGLPVAPYFLEYGTRDLGFRYFKPPLAYNRFEAQDLQYFRSMGPYARLSGVAGSKELQIFKAFFTQTYKRNFNIALRFNRYTSTGFYKRQQSFTNNFYLSSHYTSSSKRKGFYFYALNNVNRNAENGGLYRSRLSDTTALQLKQTLPVRLSAASHENRELRLMLNPFWRINAKSDSATRADHFVQIRSSFSDRVFKYTDSGILSDNYYSDIYYDSTRTRDSTHSRQFQNGLFYTLRSKNGSSGISAGLSNQITQFWQLRDSLFSSNVLSFDLYRSTVLSRENPEGSPVSELRSGLSLQYVLQGFNQADLKMELLNALTLKKKQLRKFFFDVLFEQRSPDMFYRQYLSNHFTWKNDLRKSVSLQGRIGMQLGNMEFAVLATRVSNYIYMDQAALPAQLGKNILNAGLTLSDREVFFKHLGLAFKIACQQSSEPSIVYLPRAWGSFRLFYTGSLFNNNLQLEIGPQLEMYDRFRPYAYMPALQSFYLQQGVEVQPYPYLDFFLNARLRPVNIFLKIENLLQGYAGPDYFLVPGYYQPDRAFRFGISWMFFD